MEEGKHAGLCATYSQVCDENLHCHIVTIYIVTFTFTSTSVNGGMKLKNVDPYPLALLSRVRRLECFSEEQDPHYSSSFSFLGITPYFSLSQPHTV